VAGGVDEAAARYGGNLPRAKPRLTERGRGAKGIGTAKDASRRNGRSNQRHRPREQQVTANESEHERRREPRRGQEPLPRGDRRNVKEINSIADGANPANGPGVGEPGQPVIGAQATGPDQERQRDVNSEERRSIGVDQRGEPEEGEGSAGPMPEQPRGDGERARSIERDADTAPRDRCREPYHPCVSAGRRLLKIPLFPAAIAASRAAPGHGEQPPRVARDPGQNR
jgi:hypothetical protein